MVSSTARCCASCSDASRSRTAAARAAGCRGSSTDVIATRSRGAPLSSAGVSEIFWTTSIPSLTRPKTVNCPASAGWSVTQTKNCAPAAVGIARPQRRAHRAARERLRRCAPPGACRDRRCRTAPPSRGSFDSGSPPWMMPVLHHAMERSCRVGAVPRQLDEVADVVRREVRPQIDHERPGGRLDDRLLAGHLRRPSTSS